MTSTLMTRTRRYLTDAARAFERAPVEVAVAVFIAAAFSCAIEVETPEAWAQVAIASTLVLAGAWTGTLLHALGAWSVRARWTVTFVGVGAAVLYSLLVPDLELASEAWRAGLFVGAVLLWIVALPALGGPIETAVDRVRALNGRLLLRTIGALLYTAALYAGLALALAAINNLFELDFQGEIYAHVFGWLFFVLAPWIVIGGLPDYAKPIAAHSEVAGVVHRMSGFLVPPLLALYYVILYAYAIRIAVTGEIPKNLVSPMVLAAGVLGTLTLFLFEPRTDGTASSRALRFTPPLFLPLAALAIWTVMLRVDQYGWTEFRLVRLLALVVLGGLALAATIQLLRRQRFALYVAPLAVAVTLVLVAIGPWSVLTVARASQQTRLADALAAAGIDTVNVAPRAQRMVDADVYDPINDVGRYLAEHFGPEALPPVLAVHATDRSARFNLAERIGLLRAGQPGDKDGFVSGHLAPGVGVQAMTVTVHRLNVGATREPAARGIIAIVDSTVLRIHHEGEVLNADLAPLMGVLDSGRERRGAELSRDQARVAVLDATGKQRGTLIVLHISGTIEAGAFKPGTIDALLLLETLP